MENQYQHLAKACIRQLTPYQPGKPIAELERELGITSSIKLASNENPLGPSAKAKMAIELAIANSHIYPDGSCFELKQALSHALSVTPQQLTIGNGSENILELIIKAYLHPHQSAVISQYAFLTIPLLINSYGATLNVADAKNWGHHIPNMLNAIDKNTRLLFLVNPNNPTGTWVNNADFKLLLSSVPDDVLVIVDEAYAEYPDNADYPNTLSYLEQYHNLIISRTFSKAYGLAGLRIGYSISSPEIADILNRARLPFNVNAIAERAAIAALTDHEHLKQTVELNQTGMKQLITGINQLGLDHIPSVCNFITIDVQNAQHIYNALLQEGVIVRPLNMYQMPNHIRVTIGTAEQNGRFLEALKKVMSR